MFRFVLMQKRGCFKRFRISFSSFNYLRSSNDFLGEIMFYGRVQMLRLIDDFHAILNENLLKGWTFLRSTGLICVLQFRKQC